jgi:hypothetical protein
LSLAGVRLAIMLPLFLVVGLLVALPLVECLRLLRLHV